MGSVFFPIKKTFCDWLRMTVHSSNRIKTLPEWETGRQIHITPWQMNRLNHCFKSTRLRLNRPKTPIILQQFNLFESIRKSIWLRGKQNFPDRLMFLPPSGRITGVCWQVTCPYPQWILMKKVRRMDSIENIMKCVTHVSGRPKKLRFFYLPKGRFVTFENSGSRERERESERGREVGSLSCELCPFPVPRTGTAGTNLCFINLCSPRYDSRWKRMKLIPPPKRIFLWDTFAFYSARKVMVIMCKCFQWCFCMWVRKRCSVMEVVKNVQQHVTSWQGRDRWCLWPSIVSVYDGRRTQG